MSEKQSYIINAKGNKASISIVGGFGWWKNNSEQFTNKVDELINAGIEDVEVYLNSPGGSMFEANEIANQILRFKGTKKVVLGALVASAASYLTTYFNEVVASNNTQWMMHNPILLAEFTKVADFDSKKAMYTNLRNDVIKRYVNRSTHKKTAISDMLDAETWLNADQLKAQGFVDSVLNENGDMPDNAVDDLKALNVGNIPDAVMLSGSQPPKTQTKTHMEKVNKALGLPENATEEQVVSAIEALENTAKKAVTKIAESKGISAEKAEEIVNKGAVTALEVLNALPEAPPKPTETPNNGGEVPKQGEVVANTITTTIENLLKGGAGNATKTWDDYTPEELEKLHNEKPEEFEKLFNQKNK